MSTKSPLIGVTACGREVEGEPAQAVKHRYLEAVTRHAHAAPLIVPNIQPAANAAVIMAGLDALLLTGSNSNIAPHRYGGITPERAPVDADRDSFVAALIQAAVAAGKPVLGICRGLQEINVALGGTLRDLREDDAGLAATHHAAADASLEAMFAHAHDVEIRAGTPLAALLGGNPLTVNSVHFQAIDRLAEQLVIAAQSPDGVIEAVHATGTRAPVLAVQWHPEWRPETRPHDLALLSWLGRAARGASAPLRVSASA